MTNSIMTCEAFDAELSDYIEGMLDEQARARVDQHLRECVRCAGLLRDLQNIQKEAAVLPDLIPSRDLWAGIEARIAAPVIPLTARPEKPRRFAPAWIGIAAAALVMTTAGVTYTLTARSIASRNAAVPAQTAAVPTQTAVPSPTVASTNATEPEDSNVPESARENSSAAKFVQVPAGTSRGGVPASVASRNLEQAPSNSEAAYGKEIAMLQRIVSERKIQLDSTTILVIERNLQIIDAAIEQSKAALAKDPASMLLSQQLSHALDKKVELLRTAAMLPAST
jgi:anti-sigma factor RsiW